MTKLAKKQEINVLYQLCVFPVSWKAKMAVRPLIGRGIFDISSETAEQNVTTLDREQDLNVLSGPIRKP